MISWNFPGNQDGQVKGVADAGIENFNGSAAKIIGRTNVRRKGD